ncbi:uncharacterized protein BT62DRAFT_220884 [Guyanagaster necrorhizus]|uniref:Uncharacterized protein n=1 Tax=Guyanagaster necrorhizus TaxID=856835 RepID=A0A9P7VNY2_9AGAR|nr:uncharacterized protein BT62DRAFT_220884 [Guyanagaster necrorhizus MCA 3950]KAG7444688.1 hypothetical protein BT62DRAFT_220884 [Guyanagaster necrorhizus MCA 3950]
MGVPAPRPQAETLQMLFNASEEIFEEVILLDGSTAFEASVLVTETPFTNSYTVKGKWTIPRDGIEHQVAVMISHRCPSLSCVQCRVKNTSEYRLLPGLVWVILDNTYVSSIYIHDIITGDIFSCTLSNDATAKAMRLEGLLEGCKDIDFFHLVVLHV